MERLKAFLAEHCGFSYNAVTETYDRVRKWQHDLVEIDRHVRNDISEFLSRTQICVWLNLTNSNRLFLLCAIITNHFSPII